jgi:hypothetical protein
MTGPAIVVLCHIVRGSCCPAIVPKDWIAEGHETVSPEGMSCAHHGPNNNSDQSGDFLVDSRADHSKESYANDIEKRRLNTPFVVPLFNRQFFFWTLADGTYPIANRPVRADHLTCYAAAEHLS